MKKKNIFLIYLLSGLIPLIIFFVCASINDFVPLGKNTINIFDSYTQYSGILLEFKNLLLKGNIFYSWNGGLGFNFLGTLLYYCASPLNLLSLFANPLNYPYFIAYLTYVRIFLLGLTMCFYLTKRNTKPLYIVLFSVIYALMGYTATYYYNFLWIDSVIMLPLVMHGLDKLIDGKSPLFYIITLAFTILINFYIGYMICIFALIYFIYRMISVQNRKKIIKTFIISSLLAGMIGSLSLVPSFFALKTGKAKLYESVNYSGINRNFTTFFYTLTSGEYSYGDQSYGPAQVYTTIICLVLTVFYFFNKSFSKKEKIATLIILIFFYMSFSVNVLNYAWHFFQRPIWWQSRFSFVFSFFLIITALKSLESIDKIDFKLRYRIIISILFIAACLIGLYFKLQVQDNTPVFTYIFLGFSLVLFLEEIFLADKKFALPLILIFTFLDLSVNTFNSLKQNNRGNDVVFYYGLKENFPKLVDELNSINNNEFYRMEMADDYLSNDGMYFNYHGLNYFNSVRNMNVIYLMENLGLKVTDHCHIFLNNFDPTFLSLFNFKYIKGKIEYLKDDGNDIYENPYPLSIGIVGSKNIKHVKINELDYKGNLNNIISGILGYDAKLYRSINKNNFALNDVTHNGKYYYLNKDVTQGTIAYSFTADDKYMIMPNDRYVTIIVNDKKINIDKSYPIVNKGDKVQVSFKIYGKTKEEEIFLNLLYLDRYDSAMKELSKELLKAYTYTDGHILKGTVNVSKDDSYMFTSVEHEDGMRVYVDGKEITYDIILDTFIGIPLDSGNHTIEIDYTPKGLVPGIILSVIGLVSTVIYLQIRKKQL